MTTQSPGKFVLPDRRWDIDWLRIGVVLLLAPYHAARIFDLDPFYVKNDQLVGWLKYGFVALGDAFAMRLLFLLAGTATWYALRKRTGGQYALERIRRLLVPFVFGLFVLAPPNAYYARRIHEGYTGSYLEFYPSFFTHIGPGGLLDFTGGFTIAHLWFIVYLFLVSWIALPLVLGLKRKAGERLAKGLVSLITAPGVLLLLAFPPLLVEWLMLNFMDLFAILGIVFYLIFFIYGYLMIADARFEQAIGAHKGIALVLGPALYVILGVTQLNAALPEWLGFIYFHGLFPWLTVLALLGYGKQYLNRAPKGLSAGFLLYFGEGSYPFYLLHMTAVVIIGFYAVQWNASMLGKYLVITIASYFFTVLAYDILVRRTNPTRFLFGMNPLRRRPPDAPTT